MRTTSLLAGVLILPLACLGQIAPAQVTINVQIDANQWNRAKLLEKLNQQGSKQGMKFVLADENKEYEYKISFKTSKTPSDVLVQGTGGTINYDTGLATVFSQQGEQLFEINHEATWTETGAINGTAKEIVKRLKVLRGGLPPKKKAP